MYTQIRKKTGTASAGSSPEFKMLRLCISPKKEAEKVHRP